MNNNIIEYYIDNIINFSKLDLSKVEFTSKLRAPNENIYSLFFKKNLNIYLNGININITTINWSKKYIKFYNDTYLIAKLSIEKMIKILHFRIEIISDEDNVYIMFKSIKDIYSSVSYKNDNYPYIRKEIIEIHDGKFILKYYYKLCALDFDEILLYKKRFISLNDLIEFIKYADTILNKCNLIDIYRILQGNLFKVYNNDVILKNHKLKVINKDSTQLQISVRYSDSIEKCIVWRDLFSILDSLFKIDLTE